MRHWICIPFLTCLPICKYLVTRSGERDLQTGKLKSQVWLCVCTVYSYRSWWRWKSWMFFARSSISRCHPMIKSPSTVAQLSDSESRKNLSVSNGWMTRTRLPELCHTAFDCHRWTQGEGWVTANLISSYVHMIKKLLGMLQFSLMSSADLDVLNFGDQIFVAVFYRQAQWKKIKTNIQNSKFDTSKLMRAEDTKSVC